MCLHYLGLTVVRRNVWYQFNAKKFSSETWDSCRTILHLNLNALLLLFLHMGLGIFIFSTHRIEFALQSYLLILNLFNRFFIFFLLN